MMIQEFKPDRGLPYMVGGFDEALEFWRDNLGEDNQAQAESTEKIVSSLVSGGYLDKRAELVAQSALGYVVYERVYESRERRE